MKRILFAVVLAGLAGASLAGGALLPTLKAADVGSLGKVVVSASGRTVYHYTDETKGKVDCIGSCAKLWPPLMVAKGAKPVAGAGIAASKLGVVKRPDGTTQVTYGGLGLYLYAGDKKAGQANGEALEHSWFAVSPAAKLVKASASTAVGGTSSGSASSPSMDSTPPSSNDYGY